MGCRFHHNKVSARKRCDEFYQTEDGKKYRKSLNRSRYEIKSIQQPCQPNKDEGDGETWEKDFTCHLGFMMSLTEGRRVSPARIKQIYQIYLENWRQRGLA